MTFSLQVQRPLMHLEYLEYLQQYLPATYLKAQPRIFHPCICLAQQQLPALRVNA